jgi:hypothetical protein
VLEVAVMGVGVFCGSVFLAEVDEDVRFERDSEWLSEYYRGFRWIIR